MAARPAAQTGHCRANPFAAKSPGSRPAAVLRRDAAMPDLVMFEPDIPGNAGALMRLAACTGTTLHLIGPAGFRMDDAALKRAGMDYIELAAVLRHLNWQAFAEWRERQSRRLVLLTTRGEVGYTDFAFSGSDLILLGRESAGVPAFVAGRADARIVIPMAPGARSLNVALAGAMALGEALRQTAPSRP
jgi:tRNA (cytidine/uridine-2'-O-)-methyltransferase